MRLYGRKESLLVKSQEASDEDKGTESQPENRSRRLSRVDPESDASVATHLDQSRIIASLSLPIKDAVRQIVDHEQERRAYKDKLALVYVHRVSFHTHIPQDA